LTKISSYITRQSTKTFLDAVIMAEGSLQFLKPTQSTQCFGTVHLKIISGQAKAHVVQICTNGVLPNHLPVIVASDRPWTTQMTRTYWTNLKAAWTTPRSRWWCSHMGGINSDPSTHEI